MDGVEFGSLGHAESGELHGNYTESRCIHALENSADVSV
ncbi:MAG: Uncharacterised protein [Flavobacteriia bacterium]|nr:MAG: Uncharacterised protein [Flavobacteriia bacterium]